MYCLLLLIFLSMAVSPWMDAPPLSVTHASCEASSMINSRIRELARALLSFERPTRPRSQFSNATTLNIVTSRLWRHRVKWRHRHWTLMTSPSDASWARSNIGHESPKSLSLIVYEIFSIEVAAKQTQRQVRCSILFWHPCHIDRRGGSIWHSVRLTHHINLTVHGSLRS